MHIQIQTTTLQHLEGAISLVLRRMLAARECHYSLNDIVSLDDQLQTHRDALETVDHEACSIAERVKSDSAMTFVQCVLSEEIDSDSSCKCLTNDAICCPERTQYFTFALGWMEWPLVAKFVDWQLQSGVLAIQRIGLEVCRIHRQRPDSDLSGLLEFGSPALQVQAIRLVSHLPVSNLFPLLSQLLTNADASVSAAAGQAIMLRGNHSFIESSTYRTAVSPLQRTALNDSRDAESAGRLLMSTLDVPAACELIQKLAKGSEQQVRLAVVCMGQLGIPDSVPWLIEMMSQPPFARVAGEAFLRITGLRLDQRPYEGDWPEGFEAGPNDDPDDENVEMDEDENLPWPEPGPIAEWWEQNRSRFKSNVRYLLGFELDNEAWLRKILVLGRQRERATAALELAIRHPTEPLFNVEEHGRRQMKKLGVKRLPTEEYRCNHIEAGPDDHTWKKYLRQPK